MIDDHAKQLKQLAKTIKKYVNYWVPIMGLDRWADVDVAFLYTPCPQNPNTLALCGTDWQHLEVKLEFFLGAILVNDLTDEKIEGVVVHEMCHALVAEISPSQYLEGNELAEALEERTVTYLTESFLRLKRNVSK